MFPYSVAETQAKCMNKKHIIILVTHNIEWEKNYILSMINILIFNIVILK